MLYADIIIDISHENLDKSYQYRIPDEMTEDMITVGTPVMISFGKAKRKGYVVGISNKAKLDESRIKDILAVDSRGIVIESSLIKLAYWMHERYGGTMNEALRTVMPVKKTVRQVERRTIHRLVDEKKCLQLYERALNAHHSAKARLLKELSSEEVLDYTAVLVKLNIQSKVVESFENEGIIEINKELQLRNPVSCTRTETEGIVLNDEQARAADEIISDYNQKIRKTYLLHGVTGSGKTEVYLKVIDNVVNSGKQVIMLIPEIALTFQMVKRFQKTYGSRVSFMHSRLSDGERYDQCERARRGEIDVMIGPRSALFTPFPKLGMIILDEEHEATYKSEQTPKYHARETAIEYAHMLGASVILGSATPSLESYTRALKGTYKLLEIKSRAGTAGMPKVHIVDLREELKEGNKSIFSNLLHDKIVERLDKKQQIMLFINRRGYAGFVSCRSCGGAMKCPHCAVSLTYHNNGKLICHYCGYEDSMPKTCPLCGSTKIAAFGTGTQKVENLVQKEFPGARVLRMDADTTKNKSGHEKIINTFANDEADILIGTQMIIKGHDFERVTLMGILAADMSLQTGDYRAAERTFQTLAQAAGRSGRASEPGEVVIQTYQPDHYSIVKAATEDYKGFYDSEMMFRTAMGYPPAANLLVCLIGCADEAKADKAIEAISHMIKEWISANNHDKEVIMIGPAPAAISKARDIFRRVIYVKCSDYEWLVKIKDSLEERLAGTPIQGYCNIQFDFNPMSNY